MIIYPLQLCINFEYYSHANNHGKYIIMFLNTIVVKYIKVQLQFNFVNNKNSGHLSFVETLRFNSLEGSKSTDCRYYTETASHALCLRGLWDTVSYLGESTLEGSTA